jgi:hypothetical protein
MGLGWTHPRADAFLVTWANRFSFACNSLHQSQIGGELRTPERIGSNLIYSITKLGLWADKKVVGIWPRMCMIRSDVFRCQGDAPSANEIHAAETIRSRERLITSTPKSQQDACGSAGSNANHN